jgi:hypothetical protein
MIASQGFQIMVGRELPFSNTFEDQNAVGSCQDHNLTSNLRHGASSRELIFSVIACNKADESVS